MFCTSCQARNNENNLFCTSCGNRLAPPSAEQVLGPSEGRSSQRETSAAWQAAHPRSLDEEGLRRGRTLPEGNWAPLQGGPGGWPHATAPRASWTYQNPPNPQALMPYGQPYVPAGLQPATITCAACGFPRSVRLESCPRCGRALVNNSGQGALPPAEIAGGWNWGAFMFPLLWSISHESWLGLLALIPGLNLLVAFVLGARGNELAWQHRTFQSVEHFQEVQRIWRNWSIGAMSVIAALAVIFYFSGG